MRIFCLIVGGLFILAAAAAFGYELSFSAEGEGFQVRPLGQLWFDLDAGSLNLIQAVVERYLWPPLWDQAILPVLYWPAVLVFLVPGLVLVLLCAFIRQRRRFPRG